MVSDRAQFPPCACSFHYFQRLKPLARVKTNKADSFCRLNQMREPAINCGHLQVLCVEFTGPGQGIKAINRSEH